MKLIINKNEAFILNDKEEKIASTVKDNLPFIDFNGFEGIYGWFDVDKIIVAIVGIDYYNRLNKDGSEYKILYSVFQKTQELLSDRKFTLEDIRLAFNNGYSQFNVRNMDCEDYIESLSQPKSWNIECVEENGKVKILKLL